MAAIVFTAVLAAQLGIPLSRLGADDQAQRFGWQMFSGSRGFPQFIVVTATGEKEIKAGDFLLRSRVEIDVVSALPPHLCAVIEGAVTVTWDKGSYRC